MLIMAQGWLRSAISASHGGTKGEKKCSLLFGLDQVSYSLGWLKLVMWPRMSLNF